MIIETMPLWGSFSIFGALVGLIVTFLILYVRGDIASRKQIDAVQKMADSYQKAWEIATNTNQGQAEVLNKLLVGQDNMLKILEYSPTYAQHVQMTQGHPVPPSPPFSGTHSGEYSEHSHPNGRSTDPDRED